MRGILTLAVAACFVLAGCSAAPTGGGSPSPAVTPAPVPTDAVPAPEYPPGLSRHAVDPWRLADAHAAVARTTSYTLTIDRTRGSAGAGPTDVERTLTVVRQSSPTRYRAETVVTAGSEQRLVEFHERVYAEDVVHTVVSSNGTDSYHETALVSTEASRYDQRARSLIGRQLAVRQVSLTPASVDGQDAYRVVGTGALFYLPWNAVEYRVEAVVTLDGFVHSLSSSYRTGDVRHTLDVTYEDVGSTAVTRPDWVRDGRNTTTTVDG